MWCVQQYRVSVIVRHLVCICRRSWRRKRQRYFTFPIRLISFVKCTLRYEALRRGGISFHRYFLLCVCVCVCVTVSILCVFVGGYLDILHSHLTLFSCKKKKYVQVGTLRISLLSSSSYFAVYVRACVEGPLDGRSCV